jgi:competence protein ComFC
LTRTRTAEAFSYLLDLLFPGRCLLCGAWLVAARGPGKPVCGACLKALTPVSGRRCRVCGMPLLSERETCTRCRGTDFAFERHLSVFTYAGKVKDLIGMYKFSGRTRLSGLFASFLRSALEKNGLENSEIVPVPPRPGRPVPDHVERIARRLAGEHGFVVARVLERTTGITQKSLSFEQRRENLSGGMRLARKAKVPDRAVIIDDVFTTGATMDACARILRDCGCRSVCAVSLAIDA